MRFSLFGIPVYVSPMFWLVGVAIALASPVSTGVDAFALAVIGLLVLFVSILVHELGHAFAMRAVGRKARIELAGFWGLTHWGEGPRVGGWRRAAVSLAGPFAGFALGAILFGLALALRLPADSLGSAALGRAIEINVFWGALNLLPVVPLDGGQVMEVALTGVAGPARGPKFARAASIAFGLGLAALAYAPIESNGVPLWPQSTWAAVVFVACAGMSYASLGRAGDGAVAARVGISEEIEKALVVSWTDVRSGRAEDAIARIEPILASLPDAPESLPARGALLEVLAWGQIEAGREDAAVRTVRAFPAGVAPSALLAARARVAEGYVDEGLAALERAYLDTPGDVPALVLCAALVDHGRVDRIVAVARGIRAASLGSNTHLTIAATLFYADEYVASLAVCDLGWGRTGDAKHAHNAACCCARLGQMDEGIRWLERALAVPMTPEQREALRTDSDLDPLREHPRFPSA